MNDKEIIAAAEAHWSMMAPHVRKRVTGVYFKRLLDLALKHQRTRDANAKLRAFVESFVRCPMCGDTRTCRCMGDPTRYEARIILKEIDE